MVAVVSPDRTVTGWGHAPPGTTAVMGGRGGVRGGGGRGGGGDGAGGEFGFPVLDSGEVGPDLPGDPFHAGDQGDDDGEDDPQDDRAGGEEVDGAGDEHDHDQDLEGGAFCVGGHA